MSLIQTIPINILLSILAVVGIYMLFEAIRQEGIAAKLIFTSFFIFCLGLDSTWFASSASSGKLITKYILIISGSFFYQFLFWLIYLATTKKKKRPKIWQSP
jgi:RsiW-degrading membrane proteinase PrsW (M82 family)